MRFHDTARRCYGRAIMVLSSNRVLQPFYWSIFFRISDRVSGPDLGCLYSNNTLILFSLYCKSNLCCTMRFITNCDSSLYLTTAKVNKIVLLLTDQ